MLRKILAALILFSATSVFAQGIPFRVGARMYLIDSDGDTLSVWDGTNDQIDFRLDKFIVQDTTTSRPIIEIQSNTAVSGVGGEINWFLTEDVGVNGNTIGNASWYAYDAASTKTLFAQILAKSSIVTDTDEAGDLELYAMFDGTSELFIKLDGQVSSPTQAAVVFNENAADIDFTVEDDAGNQMIHGQASDGSVVFGGATGGGQGQGTINAKAVYDDGVLISAGGDSSWTSVQIDTIKEFNADTLLIQNDVLFDSTVTITSPTTQLPDFVVENTNGDATGGLISLFKNTTSASNNDVSGTVRFQGNDTGGTRRNVVSIRGLMAQATTVDGRLEVDVEVGNSPTELLTLDGADLEVVVNEDGTGADFRVEGTSGNTNLFFVDGDNARVGVGTSTPDQSLQVTDGQGSLLELTNSSPTSNGNVSKIDFSALDGSSTENTFASIQMQVTDNTNGEEDGQVDILTQRAGTIETRFTVDSAKVVIDGQKTFGDVFQAINDADGAVGDSSVVITGTGSVVMPAKLGTKVSSTTGEWWFSPAHDSLIVYDGTNYNFWEKDGARSDITTKENIKPIDNALAKVLAMQGVSFQFKDNANRDEQAGLIGQQVDQVASEAVNVSRGKYVVSYDAVVAMLVEAIKEQQIQINELRQRVK